MLAAIAAGGAIGGVCRYGLSQLIPTGGTGVPWATFWTNVGGSFLLGLVVIAATERFSRSRYFRPFLATGLLGAFTTFSTLAVEIDLLLRGGRASTAAMYAAATLVAGLAGAWTGLALGRRILGANTAAEK